MNKLRIAEVGTIWETTPPKLYGGTERVLHALTEELVRRGHDVTLFATGDSKTSAKLSSTYPRAAYRDGVPWENIIYPLEHLASVFERADDFDIIHTHLNMDQDYATLIFAGLVKTPVVTTIHFPLPMKKNIARHDELLLLKKYRSQNFVSISDAQRTMDLNFVATVHHGLDFSKYTPPEKPGKDLVWIGRFVDDKGTQEAIMTAKRSGMRLWLAGKVDYLDPLSRNYFIQKIEPLIDNKQIVYIGEVNDVQKRQLLKKAKAFLMPIKWNEPFGLTMIEAMAMGVPVIAFDRGPVREIIWDTKTGFIVKNVREMTAALKKVDDLNRSLISQYTKSHFSVSVMADNYLKVFESLIAKTNRKHIELYSNSYGLEKTNA
jgi:glycosyltransferase involved in cell wall biosynthesis